MTFRWVAETDAEPITTESFPTQGDAEAWLTESYLDLVDQGATAVTLYDDDHVVYGPMSLAE